MPKVMHRLMTLASSMAPRDVSTTVAPQKARGKGKVAESPKAPASTADALVTIDKAAVLAEAVLGLPHPFPSVYVVSLWHAQDEELRQFGQLLGAALKLDLSRSEASTDGGFDVLAWLLVWRTFSAFLAVAKLAVAAHGNHWPLYYSVCFVSH